MSDKQFIGNILLLIPITLINLIMYGVTGVKELYKDLYKEILWRWNNAWK